MQDTPLPIEDSRRARRVGLPAMYTVCRVKPHGGRAYLWNGFVYDVSETGMRFELDRALPPGTVVDVHAMLPGGRHLTFNATGTVVRIHDDDDLVGPVRMGMTFDTFQTADEREDLLAYIGSATMREAA